MRVSSIRDGVIHNVVAGFFAIEAFTSGLILNFLLVEDKVYSIPAQHLVGLHILLRLRIF